MKSTLKYLFSNIILVGLTGSMFLAAGCPADETTCETDADCADGETCNSETNECQAPVANTCMDDSECTTEGERCINMACAVPADCSEQADPVAYCETQIENFDAATQTASCSAEKTCVATEKVVTRFVQILDKSMGGSCTSMTNGKSDAGSDIFDLQLLDANDEVIGYAKTVKYEPGSGSPAYNKADNVFNGQARDSSFYDADNGVCPANMGGRFREDSVVALGCDGSLFVEFLGADGNAITIDATHKVLVAEFGGYCTDGVDPNDPGADFGSDRFQAWICETGATKTAPEGTDCTNLLSSADGDQGYAIYDASDVIGQ